MFKLIKEEYNEVYQEQQWTYSWLFIFTFNEQVINQITITDHTWKKKGREKISKELILNIFKGKSKRKGNGTRTEKETILLRKEFRLEARSIN